MTERQVALLGSIASSGVDKSGNSPGAVRACLYAARLARVPGMARFAEITPPQKIP